MLASEKQAPFMPLDYVHLARRRQNPPPFFLIQNLQGNSNPSHPINTGSRHACFLNYVYLAYVHIKEKSPSVPTQQKTCTNPRYT